MGDRSRVCRLRIHPIHPGHLSLTIPLLVGRMNAGVIWATPFYLTHFYVETFWTSPTSIDDHENDVKLAVGSYLFFT